MKPAMPQNFESGLFQGRLRHRRMNPVRHQFHYPISMWLLKLDELPDLFEPFWQVGEKPWHWARFRRSDYLAEPHRPLAEVAIDWLSASLGLPRAAVDGEVWLLAQLRYLGCYFSPLNLYFVKRDGMFRHMLAEVSNTPWNERHCYALDLADPSPHDKEFHVSPFNPMSQQYRWRVQPPDGDRLAVHLRVENGCGELTMDASLSLRREPLNQRALNGLLLRRPSQTAALLAAIHWQALRLFLKRSPVHRHPVRTAALGRSIRQRR